MNNVTELPEIRCEFCKKREATQLCDKVMGVSKWIGHPPKINGIIDWNQPMSELITCDKKMCKKCTTNIDGMEVCPTCLQKIKDALKGKR